MIPPFSLIPLFTAAAVSSLAAGCAAMAASAAGKDMKYVPAGEDEEDRQHCQYTISTNTHSMPPLYFRCISGKFFFRLWCRAEDEVESSQNEEDGHCLIDAEFKSVE